MVSVSLDARHGYISRFRASLTGDLEALKQNKESYSQDMIDQTFLSAIAKNNIECVKYMIENDLINVDDKPYCDIAAKHSAFECLKYLHEQGCGFRKYTALICLIRDDMQSLHYILEKGGVLSMPPDNN